MKSIHLPVQILEVEDIAELSPEEQNLVLLSRNMTNNAYAPYSEFFVGAAVLLQNGEIVKGSNQENAAYPSGLCAERVAIFAASANFPGIGIKAIAISAKSKHRLMDHPVSPCGACRQALLEYEFKQKVPVRMLLSGELGVIYIVEKIQDLLPLSFTPDELG
jgi:cytidine deaminase